MLADVSSIRHVVHLTDAYEIIDRAERKMLANKLDVLAKHHYGDHDRKAVVHAQNSDDEDDDDDKDDDDEDDGRAGGNAVGGDLPEVLGEQEDVAVGGPPAQKKRKGPEHHPDVS